MPSAAITEWFGGEERKFLCRIDQLYDIQKRCGPAFSVAARLARAAAVMASKPKASILELLVSDLGDLTVEDVRETIKICLIAGGENPNVAGKLCKEFIDDRGFKGVFENITLAANCLIAGVEAPAGEGEPKPEENPPEKKASTSEPSTEPAPPLASTPDK